MMNANKWIKKWGRCKRRNNNNNNLEMVIKRNFHCFHKKREAIKKTEHYLTYWALSSLSYNCPLCNTLRMLVISFYYFTLASACSSVNYVFFCYLSSNMMPVSTKVLWNYSKYFVFLSSSPRIPSIIIFQLFAI